MGGAGRAKEYLDELHAWIIENQAHFNVSQQPYI
jgi:hypothetical protein